MFHRPLLEAVAQLLNDIFIHNAYAEQRMAHVLASNKKWGSRDRRFIAETTYEIVRYKRLAEALAGLNHAPKTLNDCRILLGTWLLFKHKTMPDQAYLPAGNNNNILGIETVEMRHQAAIQQRVIRESIPDWLDQIGLSAFGETDWTAILAALNQPAAVVLRTNTLKIDKLTLQKRLRAELDADTEHLPDYQNALVLKNKKNLLNSSLYTKGLFEVQDAASQAVAPYMGVEAGMTVIDACAGAGGKTLHLAALLQNKGRLIAMDVSAEKLNILRERAQRAGIKILETRLIRSPKDIATYTAQADRLLLDVPCSGLGVLRRHPDTKWKIDTQQIAELRQLQAQLLTNYSLMLAPKGQLTYATCSILPEENEQQIAHFLDQNTYPKTGFQCTAQQTLRPDKAGFDGFYMANLRLSEM